MNYKCDIIVLTWNNKQITEDFVESFLATTSILVRLIIIDNASSDQTPQYLSTLKDTSNCVFKIVFNKENTGFVRGMNQGIALSDAPYVCLANNDLIFTPGWLEEILSVFVNNPKVGVLNPNSNNLGARRAAQESLESFAQTLKNKYKGVFVEMPFCIGFCMFIRKEVIQKVGKLSDEFAPFLFEDTDYSLKALKAGYLIGVAKGSYVWHKEHASIEQTKNRGENFFSKNKETFEKKWGKILRILWMVDNENELLKAVRNGVDLVRSGNYLWIMTENFKKKREELFRELGLIEHSGVNFIAAGNVFTKIGKILVKKKRYDVVISSNGLINWFLSKMGYNVIKCFDKNAINDIKIYK
jgi:GT2 family glycosyltransferase